MGGRSWVIGAMSVCAVALFPATRAQAETLFVKAGANGGSGTHSRPFGALGDAEDASGQGDRIVVLRPRKGAASLDGGIALKPRQRLVGAGPSVTAKRDRKREPTLTNSSIAAHNGDAVTLARKALVRNIRFVDTARGAVYGKNIRRAQVTGNEVTGQNTSCTPGFLIPPFNVPTTAPGVGIPISAGLSNGWAGIMVDADKGATKVRIARNYVHDAECGDGIDVRGMDSSKIRATIAKNRVRSLREGSGFESVLAIGIQATGGSTVRARIARNREGDLGNPDDSGAGPLGADSEGVFINPAGPSHATARVIRNRYRNPDELGGFSANGLEFVTMGDGAVGDVVVRKSSFSRSPGDVIEQLALGTNGELSLRLDDVVARDSSGFARSGIGNTIVIPGNNGDCMIAASGGAGNTVETVIEHSRLTGCANNGLTFGSSVANGSGSTSQMSLEMSHSEITGNQGANLRIGNVSGLDDIDVAIERSDLSDSEGMGVTGIANVSFEELGTTTASDFDLGGGSLGSAGHNCLDGGLFAAELLQYSVTAEDNWWGAPGPPGLGRVVAVGGTLDGDPGLAERPACGLR